MSRLLPDRWSASKGVGTFLLIDLYLRSGWQHRHSRFLFQLRGDSWFSICPRTFCGRLCQVIPACKSANRYTWPAVVPCLPASYTLLPARYALLPGGVLVTPVSGAPPWGVSLLPDGLETVMLTATLSTDSLQAPTSSPPVFRWRPRA